MPSPITGLPISRMGNFKIVLLLLASVFVIGMLLYSQQLTNQLLTREREVVALYARSLEYVANNDPAAGDLGFAFEVIQNHRLPHHFDRCQKQSDPLEEH